MHQILREKYLASTNFQKNGTNGKISNQKFENCEVTQIRNLKRPSMIEVEIGIEAFYRKFHVKE